MLQLCYASQSTSTPDHLLQDLGNILQQARDFNVRHGISGVLYYADGYFFQCLEGEEAVLQQLLEKLRKDPRHKNVQLFLACEVEHAHFSDWSMKYVGRNSVVKAFYQQLGFAKFHPLALNTTQLADFLLCLQAADEKSMQNVA